MENQGYVVLFFFLKIVWLDIDLFYFLIFYCFCIFPIFSDFCGFLGFLVRSGWYETRRGRAYQKSTQKCQRAWLTRDLGWSTNDDLVDEKVVRGQL